AVVTGARDEFAEQYCLPAMQANALYMDRYPLVSALSRPLIAKHLVTAAKFHGASTVAHGCTGKGNDQVRFEVGIGALAPDLDVLAPVRDSGMTRDKAIAFAEEKGLPIATTKKSPYSIDQNVWGRAVETGFLEDIWNGPIEDVYEYTQDPTVPREADEVTIGFTAGVPTSIDGTPRPRSTTSTSPPTTPATPSTRAWPRASSSCGVCPRSWLPPASSGCAAVRGRELRGHRNPVTRRHTRHPRPGLPDPTVGRS